ncbi:hypothetical protein BJ170DRAFT_700843 [Xylariales sp. AK1849]|nr:hypothetical protein BJ170DRAFT_700843 [Xylariales sp. AK1849]
MRKLQLNHIDLVTRLAGAAVLCSIMTQCLSSRQSELCSEMLCWMTLPLLFRIARYPDFNATSKDTLSSISRASPTTSNSLWIVAASIAVASLLKAENNIIGLFPALTPILLIVQKHILSEIHTSKKTDSWLFTHLANTAWSTTLTALFAIFTLSNWDLYGLAISTVHIAALLILYTSLMSKSGKDSRFHPRVDVENDVVPLSSRVVPILAIALGVETITLGFPRSQITSTLLGASAKALLWYFVTRMTRYTHWHVATAIGTFGIISTRDPFTQSSDVQGLSHVAGSLLNLCQVIGMLPSRAKTRPILWAFSLVPVVPYAANVFAIRIAQSLALNDLGPNRDHPVAVLIHEAKASFEGTLQKQSRTYKAACDEYRRRYSIEPPPGFEAWYDFAVSHQSLIIDDFDTIYDGISPLWRLSGDEVIKVMNEVRHAPDNELWLCDFSGKQARTHCTHAHRTFDRNVGLLFDRLLGDLLGVLPNLKFLVNHLDEPSVLIPPKSSGDRGLSGNGRFNMTNMSKQPIWDSVTRFCASQPDDSVAQAEQTVETFGLPFVTDIISATNLCQHPEFGAIHGLFMRPTSSRLIEGLVPVLSTGSPSTMGDILFPSPAYLESDFRYDATHDIDWDKKRNNLYWAGSNSGGFASDERWRYYHRQRFVELAQNLGRQEHYYLRRIGGIVQRVATPFLNSRLFDVAFTRIYGCETRYCRDQSVYFNLKPWANKDQALRSRLVFDLDGNGMSGRYYKFLASNSVPLKLTLLREWHDDRLMPWVHYIPVSQSMGELPELILYLTSTEAGQQKAKEVAEQGRDWYSTAFRDVDLSIYTYRLLLELARLQDPKRQAT